MKQKFGQEEIDRPIITRAIGTNLTELSFKGVIIKTKCVNNITSNERVYKIGMEKKMNG